MKQTNLLKLACFWILCCLVSSSASAGDIEVTLSTDKTQYKIGDNIFFKITYKNVSNRRISLLAQTESYPVDVFMIEKVDNSHKAEKIRFGELPSVAWDGLARDVVKLQPGAQVSRSLTAEVRSMLPDWYGDRRKGIFLSLPASAARLPGVGRYSVRALFHSSPDHPVNEYLPRGSKLWRGDVTSGPIVIDIDD